MKEDWLQFIWKLKRLPLNLQTVNGEVLQIIHPGKHNKESGPDFFEASIRINNILWSGNVEIHIRSSDWLRHKHQEDEAYNNVILHVVYIHDLEVYETIRIEVTRSTKRRGVVKLNSRVSPSRSSRYPSQKMRGC